MDFSASDSSHPDGHSLNKTFTFIE